MAKLFLVRNQHGFLPIFIEAGGVVTPDMVGMRPRTPTADELKSLSISQTKRLWNAMGRKLTTNTVKTEFVAFVRGRWDDAMEHGMEVQRDYSRYTKGKPMMLFWKAPETFYLPFMVHPGEVIPVSFFNQTRMNGNTLTTEMLKSLTKAQIWEVQVRVLHVGASGEREGKDVIIMRTVNEWDWQYQRFLNGNSSDEDEEEETDAEEEDEEATLSDGDGAISEHSIHKEADEMSDIEDEDIPNIEDYITLNSDEGFETDPGFQSDPSDFINDPFEVAVKEFGGKLLFKLIIQKGTKTVEEFKASIVRAVQQMAERKGADPDKVLTEDCFKLIGDGRALELDEPLEVNEVCIQLLLKGGGKTSKTTKKDMLKKCATVLKDKVETFKGLKVPDIKMDDIKKTMMNSLKGGDDTLTGMIAKQDTKTILTLLQSLKGNNVDVKTAAISKAMFSNEMKEIDQLLLMADEVKETANAVSKMLFVKQYTSENGSINWKQFAKDVGNSIIKKTGAKVDDADADLEELLKSFENMEL